MKKDDNQKKKMKINLPNVKHKIVVLSGKGGVGKSTVASNLAVALSQKNYKVGLLDSDMHGPSIPKMLGVEDKKPTGTQKSINPIQTKDGLKVMSMGFLVQNHDDPVIWRGPMKMGVIRQLLGDVNWGKLDYMIIDLPPGTGDEPLSIAQILENIDGAVVVTTPQDVALVSVRKSINFVKKLNLDILGIVENMSGFTCPHCGEDINIFKTGGGKKAAEDFQIPLLGSIPLDPHIVEAGDTGKTFMLKNRNRETVNSFNKIVENIEKILNKKEEVGGER
ncbi:MAG: Mrp/NBP35 family ATP-binding protein [Candidatus Thermoplasmatota archaeon]